MSRAENSIFYHKLTALVIIVIIIIASLHQIPSQLYPNKNVRFFSLISLASLVSPVCRPSLLYVLYCCAK